MTAFTLESINAYETALTDYCKENNRNPELYWDDLDEIFSTPEECDDPADDNSLN